jgi:hypothetical protein
MPWTRRCCAPARRARPELAAFDGAAFDRLVADFAEADRARITLARAECAAAHAAALARVRGGLPGYAVLKGSSRRSAATCRCGSCCCARGSGAGREARLHDVAALRSRSSSPRRTA